MLLFMGGTMKIVILETSHIVYCVWGPNAVHVFCMDQLQH